MSRRALGASLVVTLVTLAAGVAAASLVERLDRRDRREAATALARASAVRIEREFARSFAAATTLGALVAAGGSELELDAVATRLLEVNGGTAFLQLAPDAVVRSFWPLAGNASAVGLDLRRHPVHGGRVQELARTRAPAFYGPFELVQGGAAFAIRVPVEVGPERRLWGLASALVRVEALLRESQADRLASQGFAYELSRLGSDGRPDERIAPPGESRPMVEPVLVAMDVLGEQWSLAVAPRGGWGAQGRPWVFGLAAVLVAVLAGLLTYRVVSLPELLRREVAARTAELEQSQRERQRAEEAQRQSQKLEAVGLLAGGVAHDFNNLLVGILGYADLLAADAAPGSLQEEGARTISQAAQRAAELTRQLLAFARVGHRREDRVDVHGLVPELFALLARTIDKSIRLEHRLEAAQHAVKGDAGQLQQVLLNLAVNARDAMPEGGTLAVETAVEALGDLDDHGLPPGRYLVLSVTDTGVGIAPEHLDRIFEPFFTTKEEGRGTGLGLATVYGIVKGHGGTVRVSTERGAGTRFVVYLPLLDAAGEVAAPPAPRPARGAGSVLVVDDEELVRRTAARILARLGFEPAVAASGREALEWLERRGAPPAAVLLDLAMPEMDGRACFRAMRARHPALRVVISSGFARNGRAQELLDEGAVAFVQKPYRAEELGQALALATAPAVAA